ncbi:protein FAM83G [Sardina pilchardus]|uniref:protein FAM83G n=1 Tax=Sardina pilchardus TaxID=27697 RepID=UPI002E133900
MANSREKNLEEDAVFEPVTEACPHFLHSEAERGAVECLLSNGPGAFYTRLNAERLGPFLSPDEVNQVSGWAQDYRCSEVVVEEEMEMEAAVGFDQMDGEGQGMMDFSACYFPTHSDTPAPPLELGWPEKESWDCMGQARVYTSPPVEDAPPVREVVRKLLQGAKKLIAIVTDSLSDSTVIGDLHSAASLGVPVYIILNQRSVQENFTPHRLRHPNMRVRVLGGKTFCSREGKMVVGELKENFILVDLEKVMVGSYSLTWSDAHLHRQLVMVMSGPVVESFDREFRILFANSLPIPDTWKGGRPIIGGLIDEGLVAMNRPERLDPNSSKPFLPEIIHSPPPSFTDQPIDWEALGVIPRGPDATCLLASPPPGLLDGQVQYSIFEEPLIIEEKPIPQQYNVPQSKLLSPQENRTGINSAFGKTRLDNHINYGPLRRLSSTDKLNEQEIMRSPRGEPSLSPSSRKEFAVRRGSYPDEAKMEQNQTKPKSTKAKKPLILRVGLPQMEARFSSLSDIMKRLQIRQSTSTPKRGPKSAVTDISRSMMDLSTGQADSNHRLKANCYDGLPQTPAQALMRQRTDDKNNRSPKSFLSPMPSMRPRSSTFGYQKEWRSPTRQRSDEE